MDYLFVYPEVEETFSQPIPDLTLGIVTPTRCVDVIDVHRVIFHLRPPRWRERQIYIFSWLQVHITGPIHHLTSSLRSYAQGYF